MSLIIYSQRDPRWASDQLGHGGATLGSDGCYLTVDTMMATIAGANITPRDLNADLKNSGGFSGSLLASDAVMDNRYGLVYVGHDFYSGHILTPEEVASMSDAASEQYGIEIFINEDPNQIHFVLYYDGHTDDDLRVVDPWNGDVCTLKDRYGVPSRIIEKIVHYTIPALIGSEPQAPAEPVTPQPDPTPQPPQSQPDPAPDSTVPETSSPAPTPDPQIPTSVDPGIPNPPVAELPLPLIPSSDNSSTQPDHSITNNNNQPIIDVMEKIKSSLSSRKFWIAVAAIAYFMANGDVNQALAVAMTYLGIQGAIDHKTAGQ